MGSGQGGWSCVLRALTPSCDVAAVMALALLLRLVWLASVPPGLIPDELSIGYDAYSLLLTGSDMHDEPYPILFLSLGEYKNPLYIYATIPSLMLFGLGPWGVRFPAVVFGTLGVGAAFVLGRALAGRRAGLAAALMLAVSPWHHHLSRVAWDPVPVPLFIALGWYMLEAGLRGRRRALLAAPLPLALALYAYAIPRFFIPTFFAGVLFVRRDLVRARLNDVLLALAVFVVLVAPLASTYVTMPDAANARFKLVSIFTDDVLMWQRSRYSDMGIESPTVLYALQFVQNYLAHLHPDFLLLRGDTQVRYTTRVVGKLHLFEGLLLLAGIVHMARTRRPVHIILLWGLLLVPVAASLTIDRIPNSIRTTVALPFIQLVAAVGWMRLEPVLRDIGLKLPFLAASCLLVGYYLGYYFVVYPADPSVNYYWDTGWDEVRDYLREEEGSWDEVRIPNNIRRTDKILHFWTARDPLMTQSKSWEGTPYRIKPPCSYRQDGGRPGVLYMVYLQGWPLDEECRFDDLGLAVRKNVTFPRGQTAFLFLAREG